METAGLEFSRVQEAADFIKSRIPFAPKAGIILGTGLGDWLHTHEVVSEFSATAIPHLFPPTVASHSGSVYAAYLNTIPVLLFSGRIHYYEGYAMQEVARPVRIMHALGCRQLLVTNAAGGINPLYQPGDIIMIRDHINITQLSPLQGPHDERWGSRFPDMRHAYDPAWHDAVISKCNERQIVLKSGIYAFVAGSNLETAAEYEFLHRVGADMVGMSTVPEVIAARQAGLQVLGLSVICNVCYPPERAEPVTEQSAIDAVRSGNQVVKDILETALAVRQ